MTAPRRNGGLIQVGLPSWVYLPATVGALFVIVPLVAILLKIDWATLHPADHLRILASPHCF